MSSATWGNGKQAFLAQKKSLAAKSYVFFVVPLDGLLESTGVSMVMRFNSVCSGISNADIVTAVSEGRNQTLKMSKHRLWYVHE